jgi:hypothetical protein
VTDAGLQQLRPLSKLRILDLRGTPVTDAGLVELQNHPGLEELILLQTNVTDAGLAALTTLPRLRRLEVPDACLTPRGFRTFNDLGLVASFPGLRTRRDVRATATLDVYMLMFPPIPYSPDRLDDWLVEIPTVRAVQLEAGLITDDVVRGLARRGRLHMLRVMGPTSAIGVMNPNAAELMEVGRPGKDVDITDLWLGNCSVTDASLDVLLGLKKLRSLALNNTKLTAAGVARLAALPDLNTLHVHGLGLTAADLRPFRDRKSLAVYMDYDRSDAGLKAYREVGVLHFLFFDDETTRQPGGRIRTLDLAYTPVTDDGLGALANLGGVQRLRLNDTVVTDEGLRHLARLPDLMELELGGTGVSGSGLRHLAGLPKLAALTLSDTDVSDDGIKELTAFKGLRRLHLSSTRVTDAGLDALGKVAGLTEVSLFGCRVSDEGVERFRAARPDCEVFYRLGKTAR